MMNNYTQHKGILCCPELDRINYKANLLHSQVPGYSGPSVYTMTDFVNLNSKGSVDKINSELYHRLQNASDMQYSIIMYYRNNRDNQHNDSMVGKRVCSILNNIDIDTLYSSIMNYDCRNIDIEDCNVGLITAYSKLLMRALNANKLLIVNTLHEKYARQSLE